MPFYGGRAPAAWLRALGLVGILALLGHAAGCGTQRESQAREESNIKPLALLYGQFLGQHRGQAPTNEQEFKQFVQAQGPALLKSFNVASPDQLFVSNRDNKPYKILYGPAALKGPAGPAGAPVVVYEQEGVEGKRFVASSMGAVEEVDESRFRQLVPGGP